MSLKSVVRLSPILHVVVPKLQYKGNWDDAANWSALNHALNYVDQVLFRVVMLSLFGIFNMKYVILSRVVLFDLSGRPVER